MSEKMSKRENKAISWPVNLKNTGLYRKHKGVGGEGEAGNAYLVSEVCTTIAEEIRK